MNRKLLPLLGIAFVVAVIATGIFYGLIVGRLRNATSAGPQRPLVVAARSLEPGTVLTKADLKVSKWSGPEAPRDTVATPDQVEGWTVLHAIGENEPLIRTRLATNQTGGGAALAIPSGMRAVSIQTPDSPGVLRLLRPGNKVDVQVIRSKGGPRSGDADIRTVLQDVEVLAVPDPKDSRGTLASVLTVLAKPSEAELLSLADASARVRVVLRNPLDREATRLRGGDLISLYQNRPAPVATQVTAAPRAPRAQTQSVAATGEPRVRFEVRVLGAGSKAVEELKAASAGGRRSSGLQVAAFRSGWDLGQALERLQGNRQVDLLSSSSLVTGDNMPVGMQAGAAACGIRVQFVPSLGAGGRMRLRVEGGPRQAEAQVDAAHGQGLLVTGLAGEDCSTERLYAGRKAPGEPREVLVLVTPRWNRTAAVARPTALLLSKP
jgi:pilus assembly protein CpaB